MLPILILLSIIVLIAVLLYFFAKRFTIIRVNGVSMLPTYKHGQIKLIDRIGFRLFDPKKLTGRIFVIDSPTGVIAIKRLIYVSENHYGFLYWFEGDNSDHSEDSRAYGFVESDAILGEVITLPTAINRLLKK